MRFSPNEYEVMRNLLGRTSPIDLDYLSDRLGKPRDWDLLGVLNSLIARHCVNEPTDFHYIATDKGVDFYWHDSYDTERDPLSLVYGNS